MLPTLALLLAVFLYAGVAAGSNAYQIGRNYNVSHLWEARERLVALLGFAVLAALPDALAGRWLLAGAAVALGFCAACCLFGLWFDVGLNRRRGLPWDYIGTDPNTAFTDKTLPSYHLTGAGWAALKLAGLLLATGALWWLR